MGQDTSRGDSYQKIENVYAKKKFVSIIFKWPYGGEKSVSVIGSWNNWKDSEKQVLNYNSQEKAFIAVVNIPQGKQLFRFMVDQVYNPLENYKKVKDEDGTFSNEVIIERGLTIISPSSPKKKRRKIWGTKAKKPIAQKEEKVYSNEEARRIEKKLEMEKKLEEERRHEELVNEKKERWKRLPNKPPKIDFSEFKYGMDEYEFVESKKTPPALLPQLGYTALRSEHIKTEFFENTLLPVPLQVTLNHLYFGSIKGCGKKDISIMGMTSPHKQSDFSEKKFTTLEVYYYENESTFISEEDSKGY